MQGNPTSDNLDRCFEPSEHAVKLAINQAPCPFFFRRVRWRGSVTGVGDSVHVDCFFMEIGCPYTLNPIQGGVWVHHCGRGARKVGSLYDPGCTSEL